MTARLRSVMIQDESFSTDQIIQRDLPVNPLSHILLTLRSQNTAANQPATLADILGHIVNLAVLFRGQQLISGSLADLAVLNTLMTGIHPQGYLVQEGDNEVQTLTVPISFGRFLNNPLECFPAVRRGDLVLELNIDAVLTTSDVLTLQVETVELLDANPQHYLKYTTNQITFANTGQQRLDLPIGNPLLGVLLWGTSFPNAGVYTNTWGQLALLVDNVEMDYTRANWETMHAEMLQRMMLSSRLNEHVHLEVNNVPATVNSSRPLNQLSPIRNYAYMDFDPARDNTYMLETAQRANVQLQAQAEAAEAVRFLPVEYVAVPGAA